jgi:hypothetical protein
MAIYIFFILFFWVKIFLSSYKYHSSNLHFLHVILSSNFFLFLSTSNHILFIKWIPTNKIPTIIISKTSLSTLLKIFKCIYDHRSLPATILKILNLLCFNHHHSLLAIILNIPDLFILFCNHLKCNCCLLLCVILNSYENVIFLCIIVIFSILIFISCQKNLIILCILIKIIKLMLTLNQN